MSIIPMDKPVFLAEHPNDVKFKKLMFIKKGGQAIHKLGNISRNTYDAELICVSNEDKDNWIGNYANGFGLFGVKFAKTDCWEATEEEAKIWAENPRSIVFDVEPEKEDIEMD